MIAVPYCTKVLILLLIFPSHVSVVCKEYVEAVHAGSSCSRKVHETTFEGLLPVRGIPTFTLRIHVIHTHVLQPLALHWIQIYCTVLYYLPYCLVVSYMPPPQEHNFQDFYNGEN
jgi:hypothetical protein